MDERHILPDLSQKYIQAIADTIVHADEEINEEVQKRGLISQNGSPGRFWDIINTDLFGFFSNTDIIANLTLRGGWRMLPFIDKKSGVLYTCMKEKNFKRLVKMDAKKRSAHYLASIAHTLNADIPKQQQLSMFPMESNFDEESVRKILNRIAADLKVPMNILQRHAVILFQSEMGQLRTLRCCAINSDFEIVGSRDWSDYISVADGYVVEASEGPSFPHNNPTQNLLLSNKAIERKGQRNLVKFLEIESIKETEKE